MSNFVHLHLHSDFSLLDGAGKIPNIISRALELNMSHIALTDHGNLFGAVKFYKEAIKNNIKPIIGMEAYLSYTAKTEKLQDKLGRYNYHQVLLAKNEEGYKNLMKLSTIAFLEGFYYRPRIDREDLKKYKNGLICLSSCLAGVVPQLILKGLLKEARDEILWFRELFGDDYYLELQDHGIEEQKRVNRELINFSKELNVKLVATNDAHYVYKEDANAQDIACCIGTGAKKSDEKRFKMSTNEYYIKSFEEMSEIFKDIPEALENTREVADKCNLEIKFPGPILPNYDIPGEYRDGGEYLKFITYTGLKKRYKELKDEIIKRADYELDIIIKMGFAGYFLIVWDFIKYAKDNDIPVGPGRGSGAGSIVAYALSITDIDPLKYGLIFERFLNPQRISMPDFDIDFCYEGRESVINYVISKYGSDKVAQIITFGTLKPKAVVKDVARVLDIPFAEANELTKLIPDGPKVNLREVLEEDPSLREYFNQNELYRELLDTALVLEGMNRHVSTHAAGIVIGRDELTEYVPLYKDTKTGAISTQYTMELLEECGLIKMDFLGLKTLTIIKSAETLIREENPNFSISEIKEDDDATFKMLGEGKSKTVFQFESEGMQQILKDAMPSSIEDLIALNSLYRPGPMQFIPQFVKSKTGKIKIKYPHKDLKEVLKPTYGVIVYQEQVMKVAEIIAGFSLSKADILRRAMGKKKQDEMLEIKEEFIEGAIKQGYNKDLAAEIFEILTPFAGYGFNKSHAAAYSVLAYQTAYLKANFPSHYMAAYLTNEINNPEKLSEYIEECYDMGLTILKPDINLSIKTFRVVNGKISYGLNAVKHIGGAAVDIVLKEREEGGAFKSFEDFLHRIDGKAINKKFLEAAIKSGLFDSISQNRATLLYNLDNVIEFINSKKQAKSAGQNDFFSSASSLDENNLKFNYLEREEFKRGELLEFEKELLGFYVSGHPLDDYKELMKTFTNLDLSQDLKGKENNVYKIVANIIQIKIINTKRDNAQMAFALLEDIRGQIEVVLFSQVFQKYRDILKQGVVLGFIGRLSFNRARYSLVIEKVLKLDEIMNNKIYSLHLQLFLDEMDDDSMRLLREELMKLEDNTGCSKVYFHIKDKNMVRKLEMQMPLSFKPNENKISTLKKNKIIDDIWFD